jgi:hypothetical protein
MNLGGNTLSFTRWPRLATQQGKDQSSKSTTTWDAYSAGNGFGMHPSTRCNSAAQRPCRSLRTLRAPGGALWVDHVGVDDLGEGGFVDVGEGLLQGPACSRLHALGVVGHGLLLPCRALGHGSSRSAEEARDLNLPVESGVRDGRNALVRSVVLFEEVLP